MLPAARCWLVVATNGLTFMSRRRLISDYEVSSEFTVCPGWECGADPEPFGQWSWWRQRKQLAVLERVRADPAEEIAAASIPRCCRQLAWSRSPRTESSARRTYE